MKDPRMFTNYLSFNWTKKSAPETHQPVKDKNYYIKMVEDFYHSLPDIPPEKQVVDENDNLKSWHLYYGNIAAFITLYFGDEKHSLRLFSPLVYLPKANILPLYRECLEANSSIPGSSLCVVNDLIALVVQKPLEYLDLEELKNIIHTFVRTADHLAGSLAEKFSAPLCSE